MGSSPVQVHSRCSQSLATNSVEFLSLRRISGFLNINRSRKSRNECPKNEIELVTISNRFNQFEPPHLIVILHHVYFSAHHRLSARSATTNRK